jgi:hypothetical protein
MALQTACGKDFPLSKDQGMTNSECKNWLLQQELVIFGPCKEFLNSK